MKNLTMECVSSILRRVQKKFKFYSTFIKIYWPEEVLYGIDLNETKKQYWNLIQPANI